MTRGLKLLLWIGAGAVLLVLLALAFRPSPILVEVASVERGAFEVRVEDDGRTRVRERYTISAPIRGRLLRTPLEPGDQVRAGATTVAEFLPTSAGLLDPRSREEARARLLRARAALEQAEALRERARADLTFAEAELTRVRNLFEEGIRPREALDEAERDLVQAREGRRAADKAVQVARYELELAQASLRETRPGDLDAPPSIDVENRGGGEGGFVERAGPSGLLEIRSPIDGEVLRVFEESARNLEAGTPILEVGDTRRLEVVADLLSQDAVKIEPGMPVDVEGWGGDGLLPGRPTLRGRVRRVEPAGFTKVSALGVEEQRVNVLIDPVGERTGWDRLGDGYRVRVGVILDEREDVLVVPSGALFREGDGWAVFAAEGGKARLRPVELGARSELEAEVMEGLEAGERVVLYPSIMIEDGTRIESR